MRNYTHKDENGMLWRFDGDRPISLLADLVMDHQSPIMRQFCVYDHPRDYPNNWVVREWEIYDGCSEPVPARSHIVNSLEEARSIVPEGFIRMERMAEDDPNIAEIWV